MNIQNRGWRSQLTRTIAILDGSCILVALVTAQASRFGISADVSLGGQSNVNYWVVTLLLAAMWFVVLGAWGSRDIRVIGAGFEEFKRVYYGSLALFGGVAIVSYALQLEMARGYVALALPLGLLLLTISRLSVRKYVTRKRNYGELSRKLVLLGGPGAVKHLERSLRQSPEAGLLPIGAIIPQFFKDATEDNDFSTPLLGNFENENDILALLEANSADALAISTGSLLKPETMRRLGWALHERGISMIMAPALTDVAGPRLHTQPVAGLPLIHVSTPKLDGREAAIKRSFDFLGSSVIILALSPLLILVSLLVKLSSPGPIFYSQIRIGQNGKEFRMYKFRSMVLNADDQLQSLLDSQGNGDQPLFKVKDDPRITRIGRILRQYSIDELPQLVNVLNGTMSLVGPRPQRESEVALYDESAHRRLLVRPGMSGLWQVNGRSNLTWEEAVRWDLYYVENWSLLVDIGILFKTFKAVVQKDGAV